MRKNEMRPMCKDDWLALPIGVDKYCNEIPLSGYVLSDGRGGSVLHPANIEDDFEDMLLDKYTALNKLSPMVTVSRFHLQMPHWTGEELPNMDDYVFVSSPENLITTSITSIIIPQQEIQSSEVGFYFRGKQLPTLRERLEGTCFQGIIGNLGYFMTANLIDGEHPWAHNIRYPDFALAPMSSYLGFHWSKDVATGQHHGSFQGAHPAAVGIKHSGEIDILSDLEIASYSVNIGKQTINVQTINKSYAMDEDVVLFTPALITPEIEAQIALCENSAGADDSWHTSTQFIPLDDRVNVFIANEGDGKTPLEKVVAVWDGKAPLPSFGAILSFKCDYFISLFDSVTTFKQNHLNEHVQIIANGNANLDDYVQIMGGLVPAIANGKSLYHAETATEVMQKLSLYGNTTSPIAQAGKESKNFDPYVREPAGVFVQTENCVGWILFDGRHELSIGANVVDVAMVLKKIEDENLLNGETIRQAVFIDGGSAMKVYAADSDESDVELDLLNRVAAGARNGAGEDPEGLNFYSSLSLSLD
jgi:hypothetical protein